VPAGAAGQELVRAGAPTGAVGEPGSVVVGTALVETAGPAASPKPIGTFEGDGPVSSPGREKVLKGSSRMAASVRGDCICCRLRILNKEKQRSCF